MDEYRQDAPVIRGGKRFRFWLILVNAIGALAIIVVAIWGINLSNQIAKERADRNAPIIEPLVAPYYTPQEGDSPADEQAAAAEAAQARADLIAAEEAAAEAEAVAHQGAKRHSVNGPIQCPSGTVAGRVDGSGNESDCQPVGSTGLPCQAYDDQNQCISYGTEP